MATQLEMEILRSSGFTVDGLRQAIQEKHDEKAEIAVPYEPLLEVVKRIADRNGDLYSAFSETIRAHCYAYFLKDGSPELERNWADFTHFIAQL